MVKFRLDSLQQDFSSDPLKKCSVQTSLSPTESFEPHLEVTCGTAFN